MFLIQISFVLMSFCKSAELINELGTFYTNQEETFKIDPYSYFKGNFMNFTIYQENGELYPWDDDFSLEPLNKFQFSNMNNEKPIILQTYIKESSAEYLIGKGMEWYYFSIDLTTGLEFYYLGYNLTSSLKNPKIIGGGVSTLETLILINGTQTVMGYDFPANEMVYFHMLQSSEIYDVDIWDLRYIEDISSSIKYLVTPIFWGKINGFSSVFYCKYNFENILIRSQITQFFIQNSTDPVQLDVIDVLDYVQSIFIIDRSQKVIEYILYFDIPYQKAIISHGFGGTILRFNKNSNQVIQDSTFLTVITTDGFFIISAFPLTIKIYIYMKITESIKISILIPYIFLYSFDWQHYRIINCELIMFFAEMN